MFNMIWHFCDLVSILSYFCKYCMDLCWPILVLFTFGAFKRQISMQKKWLDQSSRMKAVDKKVEK